MARNTPPSSTSDICLYFLAIFVSPISVLLLNGCGADFLINICLYVLGWIPGVIHAWWLIGRAEKHDARVARHTYHAQPQPVYQEPVYQAQPVTGHAYSGKY